VVAAKPPYVFTGRGYYASKAWDRKVILAAKRELKDVDFDTFAVMGLSGIVFASKLSHLMDKKLFVVRKVTSSHSTHHAEGELGLRWIFLDDFISSGVTKAKVIEGVDKYVGDQSSFETTGIGEYLYFGGGLYRPWDQEVIHGTRFKASKRRV
jgi:orotate phosphoribosyltransferase